MEYCGLSYISIILSGKNDNSEVELQKETQCGNIKCFICEGQHRNFILVKMVITFVQKNV